jgi:flavin-dependent dehydrogenase
MYDAIVVGARVAGAPTAMLLARKGHRVLLVDRASFPSDTMSTLIIWQTGVGKLKQWGLLDKLTATGLPANTKFTMDLGDFPLAGWAPPVDGVTDSYAPQRKVIDKILVDAAIEAGVEFREKFSVQELLFEGEQVVGIRGRSDDGQTVEERARFVVGADGRNSVVSRTLDPETYDDVASLSCFYYTLFSGVESDSYEDYWPGSQFILTVPTNDDLLLIVTGMPIGRFHEFRSDIESNFMASIDKIPSLSEKVRAGRREERFMGTAALSNYFRKPYGLGWALVGDSGYARDPITAFGISDAFRDAELLADALGETLSGSRPATDALGDYESARNEAAKPLYQMTLKAAEYNQHTPNAMELRAALRDKPEDTDQFIGVVLGTVPYRSFFNTENLERILGHSLPRQS